MTDPAVPLELKIPKQSESPVNEITEWVEEHGNLLYRFARYRVNSHKLAEDLVQTTFISALKNWHSLRRDMMYRARFQLRNCFLKHGFPYLFSK